MGIIDSGPETKRRAFPKSLLCHAERSEASLMSGAETLRYAQGDLFDGRRTGFLPLSRENGKALKTKRPRGRALVQPEATQRIAHTDYLISFKASFSAFRVSSMS